jgi:acyl-CoA synthetase (AMP-forming)/AMP-acid ligase II
MHIKPRPTVMSAETPYAAFCQSAAAHGDRAFILVPAPARVPWAMDGYSLTYACAAQQIARLADRYLAAGYGRGSRLAFLMGNRPEFILHWLALNAVGASVVPLNGEMQPAEMAHQLRVSQAQAIIVAKDHPAPDPGAIPAGVPQADADAPVPVSRQRRTPGDAHPLDEAALLFTSGSSGKPKACILSNLYFAKVAQWYQGLPGVADEPDGPVALTPLPFFHMNALACTVGGMIAAGGTIVPLDRFHPDRWWRTIVDSRATLVHGLGVIPAILMQRPEAPQDRRHRARALFSPGVDAGVKAAFEARFGLPILEGWAMTETGGVGIIDTLGLDGPFPQRCIGRPRGALDWRLVDDDGGEVEPGVPGELLVRAPGDDPRRGFFSGYLGDPKATEVAWEGGWFHTGDVMRVDASGLLLFVDRKKCIVRRSGENISALEVEAALMEDPAVQAAAVTPVPDSMRGEEVFAFVVPKGAPGPDFGPALLARLAGGMTYHKLPGYVALVGSLPLGATQKLQRGEVRAEALLALQDGRASDLRIEKASLRTGGVQAKSRSNPTTNAVASEPTMPSTIRPA